MNHPRLLVAVACAGMLLFGVAMMALGTASSYLVGRLGLDGATIGSLAAVFPFGILVGSLLFGPAVDRYGYRLPFTAALVLMGAGFLAISSSGSLALLRASFLVIGLGGGVINGGTNALVADISPDENRSARLSILGFFFGIGALGMPGLTAALSTVFPYTWIIAGIGLMVFAVAAAVVAIRFPAPKHPQGFPLRTAVGMLRDAPLVILSGVLFFQSALESMVNNWTPLFVQDRAGVTVEASLVVLTVFALSLTIARLLLGGLLRAVRSHRVMQAGYVLAAAGAVTLALSPSSAWAIVAAVLLGAGVSPMFPVCFSYLGSLYPRLTGTAFGMALVVALAGNMVINYLVGLLSESAGIGVYPVLLAVCVLLGAGVFRLGLSRVPESARA